MNEKLSPETPPEPGEIREFDGQKMKWTDTGYTVRQYYSHSTSGKGPGPGWDMRRSALLKYDVEDSSKLPDEPYFHWEYVEDDNPTVD